MKKENARETGNEIPITIWMRDKDVKRLDRLSKRGGVSRSHLMRNLLVIGGDYLEGAEKFGILQTALVLRDFGEWFRAKLETKELNDHAKKA